MLHHRELLLLHSQEHSKKLMREYLMGQGVYYPDNKDNSDTPDNKTKVRRKKTFAERLSQTATIISKPLDVTARATTDLFTLITNGNSSKKKEERASQIFPIELLEELEKLNPGIKKVWFEKLSAIAEETKYAYARVIYASLIEGLVTGMVATSSQAIAAIGITKVFANVMTGSVEQFSLQHYNKLWGQTQAFSADIQAALKNSKDTINVDQLVSSITLGNFEEIKYKLSDLRVWFLWFGLVVGVALSSVFETSKLDYKKSAIIASLGASILWILGYKFPKGTLTELSKEFGLVQANIVDTTEKTQKWSTVTKGLVGDSEEIEVLSLQRDAVTRQKNQASKAFSSAMPSLVSLLIQELGGGSLVSSSFALSTLVADILERNGLYMGYKSRVESRKRALSKLSQTLEELLVGDRAPLTNQDLKQWQKENGTEEFCKDSIVLDINSIGVPSYKIDGTGENISKINFTPGFKINSGQIAVVEGGNASGKTTLLQTLSGVHRGNLEQTDANWNGLDLRAMPADMRREKFIFLSGMNEKLDFRSVIVNVVNNWSCGVAFEEAKLKAFISGEAYPELERFVSEYFFKSQLLPSFNNSYFEQNRKFSGYEKAMLELGLYLMIQEPVVIMIDEAGGALTPKKYQNMVDSLCLAVQASRHIVFVGVNKDLFRWYRKEEVVGWVRMRDSIQGKLLNGKDFTPDSDKGHQVAELMTEVSSSLDDTYVQSGIVMEPSDFRTWATWHFGIQEKQNLKDRVTRHGLMKERRVDLALSYGLIDAERKYTEYVTSCVSYWLLELQKKSGIDQLEYLFQMLTGLSNFYGIEHQVYPGFHRRFNFPAPVCKQWSEDLIRRFNGVVTPILERVIDIQTKATIANEFDQEEIALAIQIFSSYLFLVEVGGDSAEGIRYSFTQYTYSDCKWRDYEIFNKGDVKEVFLNNLENALKNPMHLKLLFSWSEIRLLVEFIKTNEFLPKEIEKIEKILQTTYITKAWGEKYNLWTYICEHIETFAKTFSEKKLQSISRDMME